MTARRRFAALLILAASGFGSAAALAADGQIVITPQTVAAGGITPGDTAGYPVTITTPGSFILGGNLSPGPNQIGILVNSADVSIDFNGFRIVGGPAGGTSNGRSAIFANGDRLTVRNGTITGFRQAGIYAQSMSYLIVEDMRIVNSRAGIDNTSGSSGRFRNNTIAVNIDFGIACSDACHVEGNNVSGNGGVGVYIDNGMVLGNTIQGNGRVGVYVKLIVGIGNNTIIRNNNNGRQVDGGPTPVDPNFCWPVAC